MSKHTAGPWRTMTFMCNGERIGIKDEAGEWVGEEGYPEVQYIPRFSHEHAHRIVACVNACEGLQTDLLENITLMGDTLASRFKLRDETERKLAAQRDELLAVLKDMVAGDAEAISEAEVLGIPFPEEMLAAYRRAVAVIAKAEGQ